MDKLVRERKSLEPRIKRISDVVAKIKPEAAEEVDVQTELDALADVWAGYCAVHKKILDHCEDDKSFEEAVHRQGEFEGWFISLKNRLMKLLKAVKDRDHVATPSSSQHDVIKQLADQQAEFLRMMSVNMATPSTSSGAALSAAAASPLSDLKLPRMNMPVFSGNYLEWQSFFDLFDSLVHKNPTLKNSQKLYFLKTNLAGEAASLVSHLKIEDANYQPALQKLKSRYDKPREIANQHIQRFLSQPTLTSSSAQGLRSLHDVSDEVIRALKAMAKEDRNTWLLFILSEKVDPDTKQLWCQKIAEMEEEDITLECFLKFIESRSFALQSAQPTKLKTTVPVKQPSMSQPQSRGATAFVATNPPFCSVCGKQNHHLYQCGKFLHMSHDERLSHVNRMNLCDNCLKEHPGESCKSGTCRKCDLPHHTLLHPASSSASPPSSPSSSVMAQANPGTSAQSLISALDSSSRIDASNVLLATVAIHVLDDHGRPHACRAVLDCASQVSFISDSFCKQLGLKTLAANMNLEGISSTPTHADKCAEIIISSRCSDYRTSVSCMVLEKITRMLPCKPANIDDWPMPGSIHLADPLFHRPGKVDVLLGIELFFQLLEPGKISLCPDDSLPTLQNTKLGWVVAGRYKEPNTSIGSHASTCLLTTAKDDLPWKLEEHTGVSNHHSEEVQRYKQHFAEHTYRDESDKCVDHHPVLHDSKQLACLVDDVLAGVLEEEVKEREQRTKMLAASDSQLRISASNSDAILKGVPEAGFEVKYSIQENGSSPIKALGMQWQPCSDDFHFSYQPTEILQPTNRIILLQITNVFDPLGFLSPIIVKAKLVMLRMWELKVAWGATPPGELTYDWLVLVQRFSLLNSFQIPLGVLKVGSWTRLYLHGYCDASDVTMGACICIRAVDNDGSTSSHFFIVEPKLAPIGNDRTTTNRLELSAVVILARSILNVRPDVFLTAFSEIRAFFDSKVVLECLAGGVTRWKTFVANQVVQISTHLPSINWCHVGNLRDHADLIPRGAFPCQFHYLLRTTSRILRFGHPESQQSSRISPDELGYDLRKYVQHTLQQHFSGDLSRLRRGLTVARGSLLHQLKPFLDENGVVRVGGKLQQSVFIYNNNHPILLPRHLILTSIILLHDHQGHLHYGSQFLLAARKTGFYPVYRLNPIPEVNALEQQVIALSRWKHVQRVVQDFRRDARKLRRLFLVSDKYLSRNGSEITTRNLVGGLWSHQNERRYPTRSSSRRHGRCPPTKN